MFWKKVIVSAENIDQYLPELRSYVQKHIRPKEKPEAGDSFPEDVRFSRAPVFYEEPEADDTPVNPEDIRRDLSLPDSPAMKRYYHSWEKKESVAKTFSSEVMRMVNRKYIKMSSFYLPAGIDKRTFNKDQERLSVQAFPQHGHEMLPGPETEQGRSRRTDAARRVFLFTVESLRPGGYVLY